MKYNEAYLIVEVPAVRQKNYLEFCHKGGRAAEVERLRQSLSFLNPIAYRGISRNPLSAFPIADIAVLQKSNYHGVDINPTAKLKMLELQGNPPAIDDPDFDSSMLLSIEQAIEVNSVLDSDKRNNYEIIKISRQSKSRINSTLGYEIGYWGGDFFSLICDSAIWPMWHGPSWSDVPELAQQLKVLNKYLLFDDFNQAVAFRKWYKTKEWAETEFDEGEFCIIRVDECSVNKQTTLV
jgi:hypothetical protein